MAALISGEWYLGWESSPVVRGLTELGLIMLPNLLLPFLAVRHQAPRQSVRTALNALGWRWQGWRPVLIGALAFALLYLLLQGSVLLLGESIPYHLPGESGSGIAVRDPGDLLLVLGILAGLLLMMAISVAGEETMFRGWIQTQVGKRYNWWIGLLLGALLFGLRHLPADLFYANVWGATPQMWVSRQVQLYLLAVILGFARHVGKTNYASATTHALVYFVALFGLG